LNKPRKSKSPLDGLTNKLSTPFQPGFKKTNRGNNLDEIRTLPIPQRLELLETQNLYLKMRIEWLEGVLKYLPSVEREQKRMNDFMMNKNKQW